MATTIGITLTAIIIIITIIININILMCTFSSFISNAAIITIVIGITNTSIVPITLNISICIIVAIAIIINNIINMCAPTSLPPTSQRLSHGKNQHCDRLTEAEVKTWPRRGQLWFCVQPPRSPCGSSASLRF